MLPEGDDGADLLLAAREAALACEEAGDEAWLEGGEQKTEFFREALKKYEEGIKHLKSLKTDMDNDALLLLARLHASCGQTFLDMGRAYSARQAANEALELICSEDEDSGGANVMRTAMLCRAKAVCQMERAQEMYYEDEDEHDDLVNIAFEDFRTVLRAEPGNVEAKADLAEMSKIVMAWRAPGGKRDPDGTFDGALRDRSTGLRRSSSAGRLERPRSASFAGSLGGSGASLPWGAGPGLRDSSAVGLARNPSAGSLGLPTSTTTTAPSSRSGPQQTGAAESGAAGGPVSAASAGPAMGRSGPVKALPRGLQEGAGGAPFPFGRNTGEQLRPLPSAAAKVGGGLSRSKSSSEIGRTGGATPGGGPLLGRGPGPGGGRGAVAASLSRGSSPMGRPLSAGGGGVAGAVPGRRPPIPGAGYAPGVPGAAGSRGRGSPVAGPSQPVIPQGRLRPGDRAAVSAAAGGQQKGA